jgi:hypothetical protein
LLLSLSVDWVMRWGSRTRVAIFGRKAPEGLGAL